MVHQNFTKERKYNMSRCRKGNFVERAAGNCARRARQQAIRSTYELFPKPKRSRKK